MEQQPKLSEVIYTPNCMLYEDLALLIHIRLRQTKLLETASPRLSRDASFRFI